MSIRLDGRPDVFGSAWTTWGTAPAAGRPWTYALDVDALTVATYRVGLTAIDDEGGEIPLGDIGLTIEAATQGEDARAMRPVALCPMTPNPASRTTTATLTLAHPSHVLAVVYDALGREALVAYDALAVGSVQVAVDTTSLAPGAYVLRVTVSGHGVAVDGSAAESRAFSVSR